MSDFIVDNMNIEGGLTAGNIETNSVNVVNGLTAGNIHGTTFTGDGNAITNIDHSNLININGGANGDYYHLTQPEHTILSAGATAFKGTTIGGTALGLVPDDGIVGNGSRVLLDNGNWGSIGGSKSMILTFGSEGSPELSTSSNTYVRLASFIYGGTDAVGALAVIRVNAWRSGGTSIEARIVDLGSAAVICEVLITSSLEDNLEDMGILSNLPTNESIFEVQMRKTGGGAKALMASIELEY
jgi:hypothetical protein